MAGELSSSLEVEFDFNDSTQTQLFEGPNAAQLNWDVAGLKAGDQLSQYAGASVDFIAGELNEKLQEQEREQELIEVEDRLMKEISDFEQFTDSLQGEVAGELDEIIGSLKKSANRELSRYSAIGRMADKPAKARELIACIDQMEQLALALAKYPERDLAIEEAYTDEVWNPFTSTTMTERVKKRIVDAYEKVLKPHFFNEIKNNLNCQNTENWKRRIDLAHERMLALSEDNTSRVERKLKNEQDPAVVMQLLNISID